MGGSTSKVESGTKDAITQESANGTLLSNPDTKIEEKGRDDIIPEQHGAEELSTQPCEDDEKPANATLLSHQESANMVSEACDEAIPQKESEVEHQHTETLTLQDEDNITECQKQVVDVVTTIPQQERPGDEVQVPHLVEIEHQCTETVEHEEQCNAERQNEVVDADAVQGDTPPREERAGNEEQVEVEHPHTEPLQDVEEQCITEQVAQEVHCCEQQQYQVHEVQPGEGFGAQEERMQQQVGEKSNSRSSVSSQMKVDKFLKYWGFKGINRPRKGLCGVPSFALQLAVELSDLDAVRALVECGADVAQTNSAGKTAKQVAERMNKQGSHDDIINVLHGTV